MYILILLLNKYNYLIYKISISFHENVKESLKNIYSVINHGGGGESTTFSVPLAWYNGFIRFIIFSYKILETEHFKF